MVSCMVPVGIYLIGVVKSPSGAGMWKMKFHLSRHGMSLHRLAFFLWNTCCAGAEQNCISRILILVMAE